MNAYERAVSRRDTRKQHEAFVAMRREMTLRLARESGYGRKRINKLKGRIA